MNDKDYEQIASFIFPFDYQCLLLNEYKMLLHTFLLFIYPHDNNAFTSMGGLY